MADDEGAELSFDRGSTDKELIFHRNRFTGLERLCIPKSLVQEVLEIAHGDGHPGFERSFDTIARSWYIRKLSKHLREYIKHCP